MKIKMKKLAAGLLALLMVMQIVPALGSTYSSGTIVGSAEGYREAMEIIASRGTYVLVGQTLALDVNEDYLPIWSTDNEAIAIVDDLGLLTAIAPGTVTVTAKDGAQTAIVIVTVIDPEPLIEETTEPEEATEPETEPEGEPEAETEGEPEEEPKEEPEAEPEGEPEAETEGEPEDEPKEQAPARKENIVVVINGESSRYVYDGEEHVLDTFVATSNMDSFDESKVVVNGEIGVSATGCGTYEFKLDVSNFSYNDGNVNATFIVNNGWMKITPAPVTVTANSASKQEGDEDPELTATVVGLVGEDTIEYTLTRTAGEMVGEYVIEAAGEEKQGNYRVNYVPGKFVIEGQPIVTVESSIPAGMAVYSGTEITLTAVPAGFGDVQLAYQWQYSTDGENWTDIEGATKKTYTYIITEENAIYRYRVYVNAVEQ